MRESARQELDVGDLEIFPRPAKPTIAKAFISKGEMRARFNAADGRKLVWGVVEKSYRFMRESARQELDVGDLEIFQRPAKSTHCQSFYFEGEMRTWFNFADGRRWVGGVVRKSYRKMRESLLQELDVGDLEMFQRPAKSTHCQRLLFRREKCVLDLPLQTGENWSEKSLRNLTQKCEKACYKSSTWVT